VIDIPKEKYTPVVFAITTPLQIANDALNNGNLENGIVIISILLFNFIYILHSNQFSRLLNCINYYTDKGL